MSQAPGYRCLFLSQYLLAMTPSRPYLLRALHEWIVDNGLTPHILVDAATEGARLPLEYAENGKIVFNVSPRAVKFLQMRNDAVEFEARFGGAPMHVLVPIAGVLAVYARENGKGMVFSEEDGGGDQPPPSGGPDGGDEKKSKRPALRVVK